MPVWCVVKGSLPGFRCARAMLLGEEEAQSLSAPRFAMFI